ncbi:MAG: SpoIIE family protein phosphatase, partial [Planctomycetes bacterium]|nr:SpoIIE family protein phosphatase [Planctomycetota bacterium]
MQKNLEKTDRNIPTAVAGEMANQLQMAGRLQRDFLPAVLPNSEHLRWSAVFLPADWVSGDIYDVVRLDENHIAFYIADAVGHSMPAALLTIFLKQAIVMRQTIGSEYEIFTPAEVMTNLNRRIIQQHFSGCQFVTCCYCLLNTDTFELTYARAGHPYPILIRNGTFPEQLQIRGPLLGIFENSEFAQETVRLNPCDKFILYSDGAEPLIG